MNFSKKQQNRGGISVYKLDWPVKTIFSLSVLLSGFLLLQVMILMPFLRRDFYFSLSIGKHSCYNGWFKFTFFMVWDTRRHPNWLDAGCLKRRSKIEPWSNFRDPKVWPSNSPLSFWSCKLSCRCWEGRQRMYLLNLARNPSLTFPPTLCLRPLLSDLFFQPKLDQARGRDTESSKHQLDKISQTVDTWCRLLKVYCTKGWKSVSTYFTHLILFGFYDSAIT